MTSRRWDLTREHFSRISDFSTVIFAVLAVVVLSKGRYPSPVLHWMPLCLFPLVAAQAYSLAGKVDLTALFWTLRKKSRPEDPREGVDLRLPFAAACLLSAGSANSRDGVFYPASAALALWAMWPSRGKSAPRAWALIAAAAAAAGWAGQIGLHNLQVYLETTLPGLVFGRAELGLDAFRSRTAIGDLGRLKFSDEIVLRVRPERGPAPALLREATYNRYFAGSWHAQGAPFEELGSSAQGRWELAAPPERRSKAGMTFYLPGGKGLLPLPAGAFHLEDLQAGTLRRNRLGAVHAQDGPGLVAYEAGYEGIGRTLMDAPPAPADLALPAEDAAFLRGLAKKLALAPQRPEEAVRRVRDFLGSGFGYTLFQGPRPEGVTPLVDFLTRTRAGHCEYFATAGALILRAGGVPTRYAAGFSIQEYSAQEGAWIARRRHGHSWAIVHMNGTWRDFDPTPASWAEEEARRGAWLRPLRDAWARITLASAEWRWRPQSKSKRPGLPWPAGFAAAAAAVWLWSGLRKARGADTRKIEGTSSPSPGSDSELYDVLRLLSSRDIGRRPEESLREWLRRVGSRLPEGARPNLEAAAALHERHRFDPEGLAPGQRDELRERARELEAALRAKAGA